MRWRHVCVCGGGGGRGRGVVAASLSSSSCHTKDERCLNDVLDNAAIVWITIGR